MKFAYRSTLAITMLLTQNVNAVGYTLPQQQFQGFQLISLNRLTAEEKALEAKEKQLAAQLQAQISLLLPSNVLQQQQQLMNGQQNQIIGQDQQIIRQNQQELVQNQQVMNQQKQEISQEQQLIRQRQQLMDQQRQAISQGQQVIGQFQPTLVQQNKTDLDLQTKIADQLERLLIQKQQQDLANGFQQNIFFPNQVASLPSEIVVVPGQRVIVPSQRVAFPGQNAILNPQIQNPQRPMILVAPKSSLNQMNNGMNMTMPMKQNNTMMNMGANKTQQIQSQTNVKSTDGIKLTQTLAILIASASLSCASLY